MRPGAWALCVLGALGPAGAATLRGGSTRATQGTTPVEKVIGLLKSLQTKLEVESKTEAAQYDKYACYCKEQLDEKVHSIAKSDSKLDRLTAKVNELEGDIGDLTSSIGELATDITGLDNNIKEAAEKRTEGHEEYLAANADVTAGITAVEGAIKVLEASKGDMKDAKLNFAQVKALTGRALDTISGHARTMPSDNQLESVTAFTRMLEDPSIYEYHSNSIIATMQGVLSILKQNKEEVYSDEFAARSAFDKKDLDMKNEKAFKEKEKQEKEKIEASKSEQLSQKKSTKDEETRERDADMQFRQVLVQECEGKATLWDQRSKARTEELQAISEALEALQSKVEPSYKANEKLVGLQVSSSARMGASPVNTASHKESSSAARSSKAEPLAAVGAPSFVQLRGASSEAAAARAAVRKAAALLSKRATRLGDGVLATAALRMAACGDHFVKVRTIIKDLMARLESDAEAETTQKSFCDEGMAESIASRDKAQANIEAARAEQSILLSEKGTLTEDISELSADIAKLQKGLLEATELRDQESKESQAQADMAAEGKAATELALGTLSSFYSEASGTQFMQTRFIPADADRSGKTVDDTAPKIFDSEYNGEQDSSKGVLGLLEVILADFERTIAAVKDEEGVAAEEFTKLKGESDEDIKAKTEAKDDKDAELKTTEDSLLESKDRLKEEEEMLDSARSSLQELKSQCVDGEESSADRVAKREKEIEALKEAHAILEDWQG